MRDSVSGCIDDAGGCPTISRRDISPAGVERGTLVSAPPDDHFAARPDRCVRVSGIRRIRGTCGYPTIRAWIVSPARVQKVERLVLATPDDHFTVSPDCRV